MKQFLLCVVLFAVCSLAHADLLKVEIDATFVGGDGCGGCTENFAMNFLYDPTTVLEVEYYSTVHGSIVPGTISMQSSGFLATFLTPSPFPYGGYIWPDNDAIRMTNGMGDELDISWTLSSIYLWSCRSEACMTAYPPHDGQHAALHISPARSQITITPVPEPVSVALIAVGLPVLWIKRRFV